MHDVEAPARRSLNGRIVRGIWPDKYVDDVQTVTIHQRRDGPVVQVVQAAAGEVEIALGQVRDRWRKVEAALKPGLHGVPVRRLFVEEMGGLERPGMGRRAFPRQAVI